MSSWNGLKLRRRTFFASIAIMVLYVFLSSDTSFYSHRVYRYASLALCFSGVVVTGELWRRFRCPNCGRRFCGAQLWLEWWISRSPSRKECAYCAAMPVDAQQASS
jgi:hypothetical protein